MSSCHLHQSHGALKTKKSYGIPMITVDADFENKYDYKNVVSNFILEFHWIFNWHKSSHNLRQILNQSNGSPGANGIKLFTGVSYEFL